MFRLVLALACLAVCSGHAVVPVLPAVHAVPATPLVYPYPLAHGYFGHGLYGHGLLAKPLGHHILKRSPSPHLVAPFAHSVAFAPLAVSHQSRLDVHSSPVIGPVVPFVKPLVSPYLAAPIVKAPYGVGYYGYGNGLYSPHY